MTHHNQLNMARPKETGHDDHLFVRYLLGLLPEKDAERLDELSIADGDVASRLCAVENDLVDAYVRGTLAGDMLKRFESFYLASPRRHEKVMIARGLLRIVDRGDHSAKEDKGPVPGE
jgi:hypothetical protein